MQYAIIVTGGKQYKVSEGDVIFIEKLNQDAGETVVFDRVLAVGDDQNHENPTKFGAPVVEGATVEANLNTSPRKAIADGRDIVSRIRRLRSAKSARNL